MIRPRGIQGSRIWPDPLRSQAEPPWRSFGVLSSSETARIQEEPFLDLGAGWVQSVQTRPRTAFAASRDSDPWWRSLINNES
jgi:hypothetical protein